MDHFTSISIIAKLTMSQSKTSIHFVVLTIHLTNFVGQYAFLRLIYYWATINFEFGILTLPNCFLILLWSFRVLSYAIWFGKCTSYFYGLNPTHFLCLDKFIIIFINDNLIYSPTQELHKEYLHIALQTLRNHCLFGKLSKCEF